MTRISLTLSVPAARINPILVTSFRPSCKVAARRKANYLKNGQNSINMNPIKKRSKTLMH